MPTGVDGSIDYVDDLDTARRTLTLALKENARLDKRRRSRSVGVELDGESFSI